MCDSYIAPLRNRILAAKRVVFFTGAGMSAESGIPTFRDALTGLWERFDATALASAQGYRADRSLLWGWYEWRRMKVMQTAPNAGHLAIADFVRNNPTKFVDIITQNIDDLHERAGCAHVAHLHGSIRAPRCFVCERPANAALIETIQGTRRRSPPLPTPLRSLQRHAAPRCSVVRRIASASGVQARKRYRARR